MKAQVNSAELQKQLAVDQHSRQAELFAGRYTQSSEDGYQSCFAYSRRRFDLLLERYLPARGDGLRLLDVGCGTGHHMARLRERGFEVAGIDGSDGMLSHARANNPGADIRHSDVEEMDFPSGSFDFILCVEVLRYLPNPTAALREMARVLKPGGICLATAAPALNLNGYWLVNRVANALPVGDLVRLKQFFTTAGRLRRDCKVAGFVESVVHGVYIGPINWVERITPSLLPWFLRAWEPLDGRLADLAVIRNLSNMLFVRAVR
jgi:SAM-dependent methyltransferase